MAAEQTSTTSARLHSAPVRIIEHTDSPRSIFLRTFLGNRSAMIGLTMIVMLLLIAVFAPFIATHDPLQSMIGVEVEVPPSPRKPPCVPLFGCQEPAHYLGLDLNGRDVFSRIIYGTRISLFVGVT